MRCSVTVVVALAVIVGVSASAMAAPPPLMAATGKVLKIEKDKIIIQPRSSSGQFEEQITLQVTGTSKIALLKPVKRSGKTVFAQYEVALEEIQLDQMVAVIYATGTSGPVLLTLVAHATSMR